MGRFRTLITVAFSLTATLVVSAGVSGQGASKCMPTEPDEVGPFYKQHAPVRSKIGQGYVLKGTVRSSADCRPIPKARVEVWQVGPDARYGDPYRATLYSDAKGNYRLETHFPPPFMTRPSHIHILVETPGFQRLITQHYPKKGAKQATFDLVLIPVQ
jgi:protocatechuate 3,4-dioxygenase beta subunit